MSTYSSVKPGHFHLLIKQCAYPECEEWFVGAPASRFCEPHKRVRARQIKDGWQRKFRNTGRNVGKRSRFSREEILEIRDMYLKIPVSQIAEHFECSRSIIYKFAKQDPQNYRDG